MLQCVELMVKHTAINAPWKRKPVRIKRTLQCLTKANVKVSLMYQLVDIDVISKKISISPFKNVHK